MQMPVMNDFIKFHGEAAAKDWPRVVRLYRIAQKSGCFLAPRPVSLLDQTIIYEKMNEVAKFVESVESENAWQLFFEVGKALGTIHNEGADKKHEGVILHSDFGICNIGWNKELAKPVVFDPLPSAFFCGTGFFGSRYYDLGQFVSTVYSPAFYQIIRRKCAEIPILAAFLQGYFQETKSTFVRDKLTFYASLTHRRHFSQKLKSLPGFARPAAALPVFWLRQKMLRSVECLTID